MTWFNFFKKEVVLHCYTTNASAFNYAPIQKASAFMPNWWKELPKSIKEKKYGTPAPTMKGCSGIVDLYKYGFIMPIWSDLFLRIGKTGTIDYFYKFSDDISKITPHSQQQRGAAYPETVYQHLKIESPWLFECSEEINFMQTEVFWNKENPETMLVMPGIQNFNYQFGTHVNTLWLRKDEEKEYLFDFGSPLTMFIPLTERDVRLQLHLVSAEEMQKRHAVAAQTTFIGKYRNNKRILQQKGCPFHAKVEK